jgi:hypothetical protein
MGYDRANIGGAMSDYARLMSEGYRNKQEMALKQQQANFQFPTQVQLPAAILNPVVNSPNTTFGGALEDASRIQSQYQEGKVIQDPRNPKQFILLRPDGKGGVIQQLLPPVRSAGIDGNGANFAANDQGPNRVPASMDNPRPGPMAIPGQQAPQEQAPAQPQVTFAEDDPQHVALRNATAQSFGGSYDPKTRAFTIPGPVGMAILEKLNPGMVGHIASIYQAARPLPATQVAYQPHDRPPPGKTVDPLAQAQKSLKAIMDANGVSGKFGGANKIRDPQARATAMDLEQRIRQLNGLDTQNNGGRVQVPVTGDPTDAALMADPRFKPAVDKYIKTHKVDQATAERMVLGILKSSKQVQ